MRTVVPTVVAAPRPRKRRPSAMESLTEPPLESSTMVAPPNWRSRAKSSNSLGLSDVTMPTAETQPLQSGWHATQLKCIGNLRSSRVVPASAELPSGVTEPGNARQMAAAPRSAQPRIRCDFTNLNLVPSPSPVNEQRQRPQSQRFLIRSSKRYQNGNRADLYRP